MKRKILSSFFLIYSFSVYAQNDCKYEKNETDKFSGSKTVVTKDFDYGKPKDHFYFQVIRINQQHTIVGKVIFNADAPDPFFINKGQELIILLSNKDTVLLNAKDHFKAIKGEQSKYFGNKYYHSVKNSYDINTAQLEKLKSHEIESVRIVASMPTGVTHNFDTDVNPKKKDALKELIKCVE